MKRLLIVSNRLPISVIKKENTLHFQTSVGGLATGLGSFYESSKSLWAGWPGIALEKINKKQKEEIRKKLNAQNCHPVFLSKDQTENYYHGFCNKTLWPLFHYFHLYTEYNKDFWKAYRKVNEIFCKTVVGITQPDDTIWVHDYQLMLLPKLIRENLPDAKIGFFLHIPFPSFEIFRLFPWREQILEGLLGADLVGFHTYDYVQHFLNSVRRLLGYEHAFGQIILGSRAIKVDAFPMGIDYQRFASTGHTSEVKKEIQKIRKKIGSRKIVLSLDRLDYTKGIPQRLEAFDLFLKHNPEYKEKIVFILVTTPSRTKVEYYRLLKKSLDELVGRINGKYGTLGWVPIWYLHRSFLYRAVIALYSISDVIMVTPLRDGMNLVAKEFVATKTDGKGTLILSEMAGAAKELGEAIIVNPNNKEKLAKALKEALTMSSEEQKERNKTMQKRLQRYDVIRWAKDFTEQLSHIKKIQQKLNTKRLTQEIKKSLVDNYSKSNNALIFLDYDGTLASFEKKPEKVKPDDELLNLLKALTHKAKNEIVIISGRDKKTLDTWFGNLNMGLIAEHGAWVKEKGKEWETMEPLKSDWKEKIQPTLELYVDRTPGSFIEEKEFSLVWHYREADPELALVRARELNEALLHLTANLNIGILEGSRVIEVKNVEINKGQAALRWMSKNYDFILAIGDDRTDEDIFTALPESTYSIKVGLSPSRAKFNLDSVRKVRSLLKEFT